MRPNEKGGNEQSITPPTVAWAVTRVGQESCSITADRARNRAEPDTACQVHPDLARLPLLSRQLRLSALPRLTALPKWLALPLRTLPFRSVIPGGLEELFYTSAAFIGVQVVGGLALPGVFPPSEPGSGGPWLTFMNNPR